jgi:hypothetical protein
MTERHPWFFKITLWDKLRASLGLGYSPKTAAKLNSNRAAIVSVLRDMGEQAQADDWEALVRTTSGTPLESLLVKTQKNSPPKK